MTPTDPGLGLEEYAEKASRHQPRTLTITVTGTPAPQGSKRHVGRGILVESSVKVKPWRQDVRAAALDAIAAALPSPCPYTGPVAVEIVFTLPRPGYHYGTGRNANTLKPSAPTAHAKKPDLDKLVRSTMDALGEAGVWRDDSQVAHLTATKWYATYAPPGADITVRGVVT